MIERLNRGLGAAHDLTDLGIGHMLDELKDKQLLAVGRQAVDSLQEFLPCLISFDYISRTGSPSSDQGRVFEGNGTMAGMVAVPISNQIVGDTIEPSRKRSASVFIGGQIVKRLKESARCQVLGFFVAAHPIIDVVIDSVDVAMVEFAKGIRLRPGSFDKGGIIESFERAHDRSWAPDGYVLKHRRGNLVAMDGKGIVRAMVRTAGYCSTGQNTGKALASM